MPYSLPNPSATDIATLSSTLPSLTEVLKSVPNAYSGGLDVATAADAHGLPPTPPSGTKWKPVLGEEVPHDPSAYWPMVMYK